VITSDHYEWGASHSQAICAVGTQRYLANDAKVQPKSGRFSALSYSYWYNENYEIHHCSCVELYIL